MYLTINKSSELIHQSDSKARELLCQLLALRFTNAVLLMKTDSEFFLLRHLLI